jgi:hypothetical protein
VGGLDNAGRAGYGLMNLFLFPHRVFCLFCSGDLLLGVVMDKAYVAFSPFLDLVCLFVCVMMIIDALLLSALFPFSALSS